MTAIDIDHLKTWIGRTETRGDLISASPAQGLAGLFDRQIDAADGAALPPLSHWLYGLARPAASEIGPDGHPRLGGFLPPAPLPRRMWASGSLVFHAPLRIGGRFERRSRIADVSLKSGRTGALLFVTVEHEVACDSEACVSESQVIVYREPAAAGAVAPTGERRPGSVPAMLDPVALFRFSALTYNAHRIHYDSAYARDVEGYRGLVVQGPFQAAMLMNHLTVLHPGREVKAFRFSARSPLFADEPFMLGAEARGSSVDLWTANADGELAMQATGELT